MSLAILKITLYWSGILFFLMLETKNSYRITNLSKFKRWLTNLSLIILNSLLYYFILNEAILSSLASNDDLGLVQQLNLTSNFLKILTGIVILDMAIYLWHLLNHVVPFLWRFHRVHHSDLYMDVSTASRFHFGEILLSGVFRLLVVYAFNIDYLAYLLFEIIMNLNIQFHHSSLKVNRPWEKLYENLMISPSLHRIHHSVRIKERDSNYGAIFSLWDRLFGTLTKSTNQEKIIIGLGSHRKFSKLNFSRLLLLPFSKTSR